MATGADRLPPIPDAQLTPAQALAKADVLSGARGVFQGPFIPLLRSPELLRRVEKLGEYLRYESPLPGRIREFVILIIARHYDQQVEWAIHQPIALREGVAAETIAAIAQARRPEPMREDEAAAWAFLAELLDGHNVCDANYARAVAQFGETGTIDVIALAGYYGLLGLVMNTARTPAPQSDLPGLPPLL
jgi:4-carboxymuconolactone decarboxylase